MRGHPVQKAMLATIEDASGSKTKQEVEKAHMEANRCSHVGLEKMTAKNCEMVRALRRAYEARRQEHQGGPHGKMNLSAELWANKRLERVTSK
jgi:hypothetical protein